MTAIRWKQANKDNPLYHMLDRYWGDTLAFLARVMFDEEARIARHIDAR